MIKSFFDEGTADIANGESTRAARKTLPVELHAIAEKKLALIEFAPRIEDLRIPPSNKLEPLHGARKGQWSIRINQKYRICFEWDGENAHNVEITNYH
jgi:proteic killer suppression protein